MFRLSTFSRFFVRKFLCPPLSPIYSTVGMIHPSVFFRDQANIPRSRELLVSEFMIEHLLP